jgi:hypothetical protein
MNPKSGFAIFKTRFFYVLLGVLVGMLLPSAFALADNQINLVVNGQTVQCDVPPVIINGRTMIPIRTVATALGCQVNWDAITNTVSITTSSGSAPTSTPTPAPTVSPEVQDYVNTVTPILESAASVASDIKGLMNEAYPTSDSETLAWDNQLQSYSSIVSGDVTTLIQATVPPEMQPYQSQVIQELSSYENALTSIGSGIMSGTNMGATTATDMSTAETAIQRANAIANADGVNGLDQ